MAIGRASDRVRRLCGHGRMRSAVQRKTLPPRAAHRFEEIRNVAEPVTIAVDVMGGDRGPAVVLRGALQGP